MTRPTLLALSVAIVAGLLGLLPITAGQATAPVGRTLAATRAVDTGEYYFGPATLTVSAGDTVVWTNSGVEAHTVNAVDGSWGQDDLEPGDSYSHTFTAPGTYKYACTLHENQNGTIIVQ